MMDITDRADETNISLEDMKRYADHLSEYLEIFEECIIFPKDMPKDEKEQIKYGIKKTKKLIKKLRKGDYSIFRGEE